MSACRKSLFDTLRHFSDLQKALKNADHHRAGHPSRVFRTHPSAPLTSPAARRRRNPNPSPPHGGAAGRSPQGGHRSSAARRRQDTKPPSPGRLRAASPGRREGCGAGGPLAHRAAAGTSPKRTTGGPQTGGRPHPAAGPLGGAPPGEVGLGAGGGTDAGQAANPTPRRPQPATGPPPPRQSAPAGGLRPPAPRRPATRPDAGRPRAGRPAASHQPTPTAARAPGPGPDKAGPLRWGGGGRAGPVPARPAPDRPHTLAGPARHLRGRAGHRHGGGPGRRALQRPRQRPGRGAPGRPHTEQGPSLPVVGRRRRQKK